MSHILCSLKTQENLKNTKVLKEIKHSLQIKTLGRKKILNTFEKNVRLPVQKQNVNVMQNVVLVTENIENIIDSRNPNMY